MMGTAGKEPKTRLIQYELIDHTADTGIRVWAETIEGLFINTGWAMFDLLYDQGTVKVEEQAVVIVEGADRVELLINWLRELLYFWTGLERLVHAISIDSLTNSKVVGRVELDRYDPDRHEILHELKAVTYHKAKVERMGDDWVAEVIFDV